jgi:hypothetical protein
MSITYKTLRNGGLVLAGVGFVGIVLNGCAKAQDPLSEDKFNAFVLQTTATSSVVYDGIGQAQCMITGDVFQVVYPTQDRRASVPLTDVSSGSNLPG